MSGFVSLSASEATADRLAGLAASPPPGWRADLVEPDWLILRPAQRPPALRRLADRTLVIGDLFAREGGGPGETRWAGLLSQAWGGYVALRRPAAGDLTVLRDPSGALEAAVWDRDGVAVVASDLPAWLDPWLPRGIGLDLARVATLLRAPVQAAGVSPLTGMTVLSPGSAWCAGRVEQAWRPAGFANGDRWRGRDLEQALRVCVDGVTAALGQGRAVVEISGGLDSAIVAASLRAVGGEIVGAVNYHVEAPEGDERAFAREVTQRLGLALTEVGKPETALDLARLSQASCGLRPAVWAIDTHHDLDLAARCEALGAEMLFTGQGGDNVFFQTPTPLIAADGLRAGLTLGRLAGLARWQGRSVYAVLCAAVVGAGRSPLRSPVTGLAGPDLVRMSAGLRDHPWLANVERVAPAKQLQIASLLGAVSAQGPTLRSQAAALRRPLLTQPLMELGLSIPTLQLTRGGRDRGLARSAFAARLPSSVIDRRAKGRLSAHYGRIIALSLADLRPLLLDGRLVAAGLLDRAALDRMLRVDWLIWRGGVGDLVQATMTELWVSAWEARLTRLPKVAALV